MGEFMNIKEIKNKVKAILDMPPITEESALLAAIDSAARKIAVYTKCIRKRERIFFSAEKNAVASALPEDFAVFGYVARVFRIWGREHFEIVGGKIKSTALGAGEYELCYFAYPPAVTEETAEETELFADGYICDAVAYGAAMELCANIYPGDVQRYMRVATEYDERMANAISAASAAVRVANAFFSGIRGGFI